VTPLASLFGLFAAAWAPPPPAVAEPSAPPEPPEDPLATPEEISPERARAAELFAAGELAFDAGDFAAAAEAFARAESIASHPDTLYNLGLALAQDGQVLAAWEIFERLDSADARHQSELLRRRLSFVSVLVENGETVCLDGQPMLSTEPTVTIPGSHDLKTARFSRTLSLQPGQSYTIDLRYYAPPVPAPAPSIAPWLGISIGASAASLGLGVAASQVRSETTSVGLTVGAATVAGLAVASGVVALVAYRRKPAPAPKPVVTAPC